MTFELVNTLASFQSYIKNIINKKLKIFIIMYLHIFLINIKKKSCINSL